MTDVDNIKMKMVKAGDSIEGMKYEIVNVKRDMAKNVGYNKSCNER